MGTIKVYHGSLTPRGYDNLVMWGPSKNKQFFVTRSKSLALQAANGEERRVLEYEVPEDRVAEILGEEKPYAGMIGEGTQFAVEGSRAQDLHNFLNPKQKRSLY